MHAPRALLFVHGHLWLEYSVRGQVHVTHRGYLEPYAILMDSLTVTKPSVRSAGSPVRRTLLLLLLAIALLIILFHMGQIANPYSATPASGAAGWSPLTMDMVPPADFTISAKPTTLPPMLANSSGNSTIYVNSTLLFPGTVNLATAISPNIGLECTLTPPSVTLLLPEISQTSILSCKGLAGSYTVTVTGTSGASSQAATVYYTVQDFSVSASSPILINAGVSGMSTITVGPVNGFTGTVNLTANVAAGLTCQAITPNSITNSGTAMISCSSTSAGNYTVVVTAKSGSLIRTITVTYTVGDFAIGADPASITTTSGRSINATILLVNQGYNGQVILNAALVPGSPVVPGLAMTVTPSAQTLVAGSSPLSSTLSIGTTVATPAARYNIVVTCTNCVLLHNRAITLVIEGNFTIVPLVSQLHVVAGSSVTANVTVTSAGLNEIVSLTATAPGAVGFTPPPSFLQSFIFLRPGSSNMTAITIYTSNTALSGSYVITATGNDGNLVRTIRFNVTITDFSILVSPNSISISPGLEGNSTITITGLLGFNGTVTLTALPTASLLTSSLSSTSITLTPVMQNGNSTLFVRASSNIFPGVYTVKVKGASGLFLSHTATLTISVVEFGISVLPIVSFQVGTSQSTPLQIISHGFQGLVTLSIASVDPSNGGLTATIVPNTVRISADVSGSAILSLFGISPGRYYLTINGTSGTEYSLQHLWVFVGDFTISSNTPSIILVPGGSRSFTLTMAGEDSFAGTITLNGTSDNVDLQVVLNHSSVTLAQVQTLTVTITITAAQSARSGTYTISVSGYVGQLSHSITIPVKVAYPPSLDVPSLETVNPGIVLTFYVNVTDSDPSVTLSSSPLPSGASFVPTYRSGTISVVTGIFNWKPSSSQSGDYVITFTAQDRNGGVTTRQVTVHVNSVNRSISLPPLRMILYGLIIGAGVIVTLVGSVVWRQKKLKASPTSTMPS